MYSKCTLKSNKLSGTDPRLRIRTRFKIGTGSAWICIDFGWLNLDPGPYPEGKKLQQQKKIEKVKRSELFKFKMLNFLFCEQKAFPVAWTSFIEA